MRDCKKIIDDDIGKEEYMPTDERIVLEGRILLLTMLIVLWSAQWAAPENATDGAS